MVGANAGVFSGNPSRRVRDRLWDLLASRYPVAFKQAGTFRVFSAAKVQLNSQSRTCGDSPGLTLSGSL
ncbi:type I-E CRISPR-associated endoribonuclease Cas2 [Goodfellowiella coeruleoviolacea]|uniref:type I-E CRISPR-associated endoribonuclease Cas2 n=1 Tax=Goodfellowiella coeruleoviolacea TaxID=334858 RepID=UPI0038994713